MSFLPSGRGATGARINTCCYYGLPCRKASVETAGPRGRSRGWRRRAANLRCYVRSGKAVRSRAERLVRATRAKAPSSRCLAPLPTLRRPFFVCLFDRHQGNGVCSPRRVTDPPPGSPGFHPAGRRGEPLGAANLVGSSRRAQAAVAGRWNGPRDWRARCFETALTARGGASADESPSGFRRPPEGLGPAAPPPPPGIGRGGSTRSDFARGGRRGPVGKRRTASRRPGRGRAAIRGLAASRSESLPAVLPSAAPPRARGRRPISARPASGLFPPSAGAATST